MKRVNHAISQLNPAYDIAFVPATFRQINLCHHQADLCSSHFHVVKSIRELNLLDYVSKRWGKDSSQKQEYHRPICKHGHIDTSDVTIWSPPTHHRSPLSQLNSLVTSSLILNVLTHVWADLLRFLLPIGWKPIFDNPPLLSNVQSIFVVVFQSLPKIVCDILITVLVFAMWTLPYI